MPDRRQSILDVLLVDILDRNLPDLWQYMQFKRREPPASFAVSLQLSLAGLEGFCRDH